MAFTLALYAAMTQIQGLLPSLICLCSEYLTREFLESLHEDNTLDKDEYAKETAHCKQHLLQFGLYIFCWVKSLFNCRC